MPNWKLHNKLAAQLGISIKTANWVNKREDRPHMYIETVRDGELRIFLEQLPNTPPTYEEMAKLGEDYLMAWILHLVIDEIEDTMEYLVHTSSTNVNEEIKELVETGLCFRIVPPSIKVFVLTNLQNIISEIHNASIEENIYYAMDVEFKDKLNK